MAAEWDFLVTLSEQLRPLSDPVEIQDVTVCSVGAHLRASRVDYAYIEGDEFVISRSYTEGSSAFPGRGPLAVFGNAVVDACRRGETVAVNNVHTDPRLTDAEREQLLLHEIAALINMPLIKDGRWVAIFSIHSVTPRSWTHDEMALVTLSAQRTWAAGQRARVEDGLRRTEGRQAFLLRLNDAIRPLADPRRILQESCRLLGTHLGVNRVSYGEIDGDECVIVGEYVDGVPPQTKRFPWRGLGGSRAADILKGGTLSVNDTSADAHTPEEHAALHAAGIGAYICPLLIKQGRFVAAFGIHSRSPRIWTPDEIALVQEVADRIWATLEHQKADSELRANEDRLAFLLKLNDAVRPLNDSTAVLQTAARLLGEHLGVSRVGYAEMEGREYVIRAEYTSGVPPLAERGGSGTFGAALRDAYRRGDTVVVTDVDADPRFTPSERISLQERRIAAFIGVTLIKGGQLVAAFGTNNATPRAWTATEIALVRDVAERTWDAVERARAEAALREREQRFGLALAASGGGYWIADLRNNQLLWDDAFRTRFGFTPETPPRFETWLEHVDEKDRSTVLSTLEEVRTAKDTWDNTYRFVRDDGTVLWMQSLGRADRDSAGQVTRLTGLELDITERRHLEEQLEARREAEHDRELRVLLETATQGIVSADVQGVILSANAAFQTLFRWPQEELIGQPMERVIPSLSYDRHERRAGVDLVGVRRDGSMFPVAVSVNFVPTPGGGRVFAFVTDITERQRAASALQERTVELEHRTMQLSRMAWDLTLAEHHAREQIAKTLHDGLQQLLVIAALNLDQQLKREAESGGAPSDALSEAKLHLDEAMAAARSLNVELFPPVLQRSGLPAALTWLANWARDKYKLDVQILADPRADAARKDVRTLLFESVRELLLNAVKYAQTDRVTLELTLDDDDQLCLTVTDRGAGFDVALLDARSKAVQVGWGLFSIRERLTLLGGQFEITSAPGEGTQVRLIAPRADTPRAAALSDEMTPATSGLASTRSGKRARQDPLRILIVDDHAAVRNALREMLRQRPPLSVVGEASNGFEAIAHAHTLRPDVILMDVAMPHMDGIEATARIHAELPHIRVLGLSMQARGEIVEAMEHAGAVEFFVKGTDTQRLIDHLLTFYASRVGRESQAT